MLTWEAGAIFHHLHSSAGSVEAGAGEQHTEVFYVIAAGTARVTWSILLPSLSGILHSDTVPTAPHPYGGFPLVV